MERNSWAYKARRKMQMAAYYIFPHEWLSNLYCQIYLHEKMDIKNPKTFNEKLQWLKLYYYPNTNLAIKCTDKYAVRTYVSDKGYGHILNKLLGVWDKAENINWNKLPDQFVLKCNHGCAYNIICEDKKKLDIKSVKKQLNKWIKENFAAFNVEVHYENIQPRRIICEEYLGETLIDYKFFCFNGEPQFFYVSSDLIHDRQAEMGFFNMDGSKIPLIRNDYKDIGDIRMPSCLDEMITAARRLSEDFPFVRVDFFLTGDSFKFAELTFTPAAAMMPINPKKYDIEWGNLLNISRLVK